MRRRMHGGWRTSRRSRRTDAKAGLVVEPLEARHLLAGVTTTFLPDPFPNVAPRVFDRVATVERNTPTRTPSVVLGQFDVEGDALSVAAFTQAGHGVVTANGDGTFTYSPNPDYTGADAFQFTVSDGRGGLSTGTMNLRVVRGDAGRPAASFVNLARMQAGGVDVDLGPGARVVPRAVDFDGDGMIDILAGAGGTVWYYRNVGTPTRPVFAAAVRVEADGAAIDVAASRTALSYLDMDADGRTDLVVVGENDLKARLFCNVGTATAPRFAAATFLEAADGGDFVVADVRAEVADWDGDGLPDILTGSFSGSVQVASNVGTPAAARFAPPTRVIDATGRTLDGSYNLNVRVLDVDQDGVPDLVDSYNWGTINYRINTGTAALPQLPGVGTFAVTGADGFDVNFHGLSDGPVVDLADLDGDGTVDLVAGGEIPGTLFIGWGESGRSYLRRIDTILAAHPTDLGAYLADPAHAAERVELQRLEAALHDYVVNLAGPTERALIYEGLIDQIKAYPNYFRLQSLDVTVQPGIPSLAAQTWLTALATGYHDPAIRAGVCDAAEFPARGAKQGAYRKLVEDLGLFLFDNLCQGNDPDGLDAEAVYQFVKNLPRNVYPGTGITNDWLGGRTYLVRGHLKNIFTGLSFDGVGEFGFGEDAVAVLGGRGSENWYMTVVAHECMHDMDAFVRTNPSLTRRWGRMLVAAGGHDDEGTDYLKSDPQTGWYSESLTREFWLDRGWWNGTDDWAATFAAFYESGPGAEWNRYGFMRGSIAWFHGAPQESLATQGNQFWNSGEGRIQVAIDRFRRGFTGNATEVLFFMDVLSQGLDKMQLCENDDSSNRVISFARLHRNPQGFIDQVDVNGRSYRFAVDDQGVVTAIPPDAPTVRRAVAGDGLVSLSWTPPAFDGGSAITGYVIEYRTKATAAWKQVPVAGAVTAVDLAGLANGTGYRFRVFAVNAAGRGPATAASPLITPARPAISVTGRLAPLSTTYGSASAASSIVVRGSRLWTDLIVTAPRGFEISIDAVHYGRLANLATRDGAAAGTVFVRLAADAMAGVHRGSIVVSTPGIASRSFAIPAGTVLRKPLSITGLFAESKIYDGSRRATLSGTPALSGVVARDDVVPVGTPVGTFATRRAGAGRTVTVGGLAVSGAAAANYRLAPLTLAADLLPRVLTVRAVDTSKRVGGRMPTLTATITGFAPRETAATALVGAASLSTTATRTSPAGTYPIRVTWGTLAVRSGDYAFRFVDGTLGVVARPT
ncbi:MAG: FG-GAP-like repeat-containing protein [Planctomycetia bacterium]